MPERIILLGVACATFVVTLGVSSWHEGLWHSGDSPTAQDIESARRTRTLLSAGVPATQPGRPFAPAVAAPEVAAPVVAAPPVAAPSPPPTTVESTFFPAPAGADAEESEPFTPEVIPDDAETEPSTRPEVDNGEH